MKALVKTASGPGHLEFCDCPDPRPAPGQVLVRMKAIGVCGTDVHIMHGTYRTSVPVIIGHEFAGEIAAVGEGVSRWRPGDRVVAENIEGACGICELCRTGNPHICAEKKAYGTDSNGAMAEFAVFNATAVHRLPEAITYEMGAVLEPLAVVNRGVLERGSVRPESTAVVIGPGSIGLLAVQVCRAAGCREIILAGTDRDVATRLPMGRVCGATRVVNAQREDLRAIVAAATDGQGADLVIEAAGSPRAVQESFHLVGRGKVIAAIGLSGREVSLDWDLGVFKEVDVRFSKSSTYLSWDRAISQVSSGRVDVRPLITHTFPLARWREALDVSASGEAVKAVLIP